MERTSFKRKLTKPLKRSRLKKVSKQPISKLQRLIWNECKRIIRKRYAKNNGKCDCYTCGAVDIEGSNCHTGHLWAKASLGAFMKYDLRVLRPQCYKCNIHYGGMGADYRKKMIQEIGEESMNKLESDRNISVKAYDFYLELLEKYKNYEI